METGMAEVEWANMKAGDIRGLSEKNAVAMIPIGSIEQHGPHLPVQVDSLLVSEVAVRTARLVARHVPIVVLPTIWSGLAEHHMSLGGTLTLDLATFFGLVRAIVRSVARNGLSRILLLNGHGGNMSALNALVGELSVEMSLPIALATYWIPAQQEFSKILEKQVSVAHACEAETSMLLALRPDLVAMSGLDRVEPPREWGGGSSDVYLWRSVSDWSPSGVAGVPTAASAEKGERLLDAAARALADRLRDGRIWSIG
jgi:creatinine amidohydrolase